MNKRITSVLLFCLVASIYTVQISGQTKDLFPDGTPIPEWFREIEPTDINKLGKHYRITDYNVLADSAILQTEKIQAVINKASDNGGGVIIIPKGVFLSGSLFFRPKTHLYLEEGAMLKGSDDISDFDVVTTRIEGQSLKYFAALVNADGVDGFTISGKGTINGNGLRFWKAFWLRRQWNPKCTNMDEQRPRLLFVSNSKNVRISGIRLINSPFWTTHFYKCENLKLLNLYIYAPTSGVKAPSSDAVDLDVCQNVLIKNCYMSINDDAIALKGGKGPTADQDPNNGTNRNILIEDNVFELCPALTFGSESVHTYNVIMRRCKMINATNIFLIKMRPDTPQKHEYVLIEDITGTSRLLFNISPWTQFFDLKGHPEPRSSAKNITVRNCKVETSRAPFNVVNREQYTLSDFTFENLNLSTPEEQTVQLDFIHNLRMKNVTINNKSL